MKACVRVAVDFNSFFSSSKKKVSGQLHALVALSRGSSHPCPLSGRQSAPQNGLDGLKMIKSSSPA